MAKKTERELVRNWEEVNPASLAGPVAKAFAAYKAEYAKVRELREAFEALAGTTAGLPAGLELVFGYNFGKLSIAIAKARAKGISGKAINFADLKV